MLLWRNGDADRALLLFDEAADCFREVGHQVGLMRLAESRARIDLGRREMDYRQAREQLREVILLGRNSGLDREVWYCLGLLGFLAVKQGDPAAGLRLIGATASHLNFYVLDQFELAEREESLAAARLALGAEEFARAWAEGQVMTFEQAVDDALAGDGSA